MKKFYSLLLFLVVLSMPLVNAQESIKLWEGIPPTDNKLGENDQNTPEMFVYKANSSIEKNMAVIICPGGGYGFLAINHEGHEFAKWLQSIGITAVVLKYRLPNQTKMVPLEDVQQAILYARKHLGTNPSSPIKVGVAGFSAGGHLASTAATHFDDQNTRPDFSILFYPVITMGEYTHQDTKRNLLGEDASANDAMYFSNEMRTTNFTPPAILFLSNDDDLVSPMNSVLYYTSLKQQDVPVTLYIFPEGGHGWGMNRNFKYHNQMLGLLKEWLFGIDQ